MNFSKYLPQVVNALNEYGIEIIFFRDVYMNEVGVKTLKEQKKPILTVRAIIENSKGGGSGNNKYTKDSLMKPTQTAIIYIAYVNNIVLKNDDYVLIDGVRYTIDMPQDILHYHLLYQLNAEVSLNE